MLKTIIAGTRTATFENVIKALMLCPWTHEITSVLSGCAPGADTEGEKWAKYRSLPIERFPADWNKHGKAAGPIRNVEMARNADALIAVWDGESRGTLHMMEEAEKRKLRVFVYRIKPTPGE